MPVKAGWRILKKAALYRFLTYVPREIICQSDRNFKLYQTMPKQKFNAYETDL